MTDTAAEAVLEHFNVYALEGRTGHVLWKHDGVEVVSEQSQSLPQHAYSHTHHATGINDFSIFRQAHIDELSHSWNSAVDTNMRIAHFIHKMVTGKGAKFVPKNKKGKGRNDRQATKLASSLSLLQPVEDGALIQGASLPHSAAEHTLNPNVIVLTHDDVDGDRVIDTTLVVDFSARLQNSEVANHFATVGIEAPHCTLVVLSGLSVQSELFR
eukprot:gene39395-48687_t